MNVYDFDDTIYRGDSTVDFYKFCLRRKPYIIFKFPIFTGLLFVLKIKRKVEFKEKFFRFLKSFENIDAEINKFWSEHECNIKEFYLKQRKDDDVVISASPYFLLKHISDRLNIEYLIASNVDKETGKYDGENCWGEEKVKRFREIFPEGHIDQFYSDSLSDSPLARVADKAYMVVDDKLISWNDYVK